MSRYKELGSARVESCTVYGALQYRGCKLILTKVLRKGKKQLACFSNPTVLYLNVLLRETHVRRLISEKWPPENSF